MAAPGGTQVEQGDTAVPGGTEVLHVYSTGLNGSLPHDMPAEQSSATSVERMDPACPKCMPTKVAKLCQKGTYQGHPLRSHAKYIEFCRCLLDDEGHQCWRDILDRLGLTDPGSWIRYSVKSATLPLLPTQLALPAPVWPMVSLHSTDVPAACAALSPG